MLNHHTLLSAALAASLLWTTWLAATPAAGQVSLRVDAQSEDGDSRLESALARRVSLEVVDAPLREVIEKVAERVGVTIRLSKKIADVGVQPDQPVTLAARNVSADNLLSLLLRDLNLTILLKNEVVLVTTIEDAQSPENMLTRVYPVADLVDLVRLPRELGGGVGLDFDPIIEMITTTIEPDTWQDVGGPGSITGFENSRSLVISTRRDLHQKIAPLIVTLRRAKGLQGIREFEPRIVTSPSSAATSVKLSAPLPVPNREHSRPATLRIRPPSIAPSPSSVGGGGLF